MTGDALVPIHTRTWPSGLTAKVPGWYFWYLPYPSPDKPWHAVPGPSGSASSGPTTVLVASIRRAPATAQATRGAKPPHVE